MDAYEKAAKHLPAKSAETKALKSEYLEVVQDKKSNMSSLAFID